jgi:hypothetical protein
MGEVTWQNDAVPASGGDLDDKQLDLIPAQQPAG